MKKKKINRSSETGKFVSDEFTENNPSTTQTETVEAGKGKTTGKEPITDKPSGEKTT
jgi:hypothetical protein